MYQEIKDYLENTLKYGSSKELEKANRIIEEMHNIGLLDNQEYLKAVRELESRLVTLGEGLEGLNLGSRARTVLRRSGIKTKSDLKHILTGRVERIHFLKIRNMGEVTEDEIINVALKHNIITYEELGQGYKEVWEIRQWKKIKERVEKKLKNNSN